ncbi:nuclear transport factor 2 family protein [Nocardia sp. CC227C]|uniref:nuclear transport factor 2 family protein n=1 Tax=Nocardia sp. CC227C TaxID=3044562 RepID=UPI00278BC65A|nr:nuclear transport factor 2 family protein [Nocardia sp. CC227C]
MDQTVTAILGAIEADDWTTFAKLVHPYVHWSENGRITRGRTRVMAMLAGRPHHGDSTPPARAYELRDGQVYRWTS